MAISVRSMATLPPAQKVGDSDLTHVGQGTNDRSLAMALLIRSVMNRVHPVGIVEMFTNSQNPNNLYPGQVWRKFTEGNGSTIRTANDSGTDVKEVGGADLVELTVANLPAHSHGVNLTGASVGFDRAVSSQNGGHTHGSSLAAAGDHQHQDGMRGPGQQWGTMGKGTNNTGTYPRNYTSVNGRHAHSVGFNYSGVHTHNLNVGAHSHAFQGDTGARGNGYGFAVRNEYIMFAHWIRES